jgi:hypothetical protein
MATCRSLMLTSSTVRSMGNSCTSDSGRSDKVLDFRFALPFYSLRSFIGLVWRQCIAFHLKHVSLDVQSKVAVANVYQESEH